MKSKPAGQLSLKFVPANFARTKLSVEQYVPRSWNKRGRAAFQRPPNATSNMTLPPFSLDQPFYDQSTYDGRVKHFVSLIDPSMCILGDADIAQAQGLLDKFRTKTLPEGVTLDALWRARQIKESAVHPQSGEILPFAYRMSTFVPANLPIAAGMTMCKPTIRNAIFWQWVNQTYNAAFNYGNRNTSIELSQTDLLTAYGAAVVGACGVAVGLGEALKRANLSPGTRSVMQLMVPFAAVAGAGSLNLVAVRYKEMKEGVEVSDKDGHVYGKSVIAGQNALAMSVATRIVLPAPVLFLPPLVMSKLKPLFPPIAEIPLGLVVFGVHLLVAFPCAVALFPQVSTINTSDLEPEFHGLKDRHGKVITELTFNKGV